MDDIISNYKIYAKYSIFESYAMKNKESLSSIPFSDNSKGDFIYMTNRKFKRYSYLFDELENLDVYNNAIFEMGYAALLVCEKLEYIENTQFSFTEFDKNEDAIQGDLVNKYCIFQNPLNKLVEYGSDDILEVYDNYDKAYKKFISLSSSTSVLLARIKAHMNWH